MNSDEDEEIDAVAEFQKHWDQIKRQHKAEEDECDMISKTETKALEKMRDDWLKMTEKPGTKKTEVWEQAKLASIQVFDH